ncbi:hypothetical protein [Bacillus pumilus]|uniref:hypothetical protein n=1 Tax=Bacillus pumilus TaxID=1408 RepID=UPI001C23C1BD|nr:hypothetical protein [Bacillus pumilus]MBU8573697.1 hypothetical protein [Bacillus pumilus]
MNETFSCIQCGKVTTIDIEFCCDGYECGCKGLPIHPPTCSKECDENFFGRGENNDN